MRDQQAEWNHFWSGIVLEELHRCGLEMAFLSPGSRSTPLTVAAARHPRIKTLVCYDERAAAFAALGYARAAGRPAALICTSGTAVANYFPAVVEAWEDQVPLLILSADRPWELRNSGANQTIRQRNIFGDYTRWNEELPEPRPDLSLAAYLGLLDHVYKMAVSSPEGPVHLNCPFPAPLAPPEVLPESIDDPLWESWKTGRHPRTRIPVSERALTLPMKDSLAGIMAKAGQGIVIVGRLAGATQRQAAAGLISRSSWPVFADVTSGVRSGQWPGQIQSYDLLLRQEALCKRLAPGVILHLGGQFVSKALLAFVERHPPKHYIHVSDSTKRYDAHQQVTLKIEAGLEGFCKQAASAGWLKGSAAWLERWKTMDQQVRAGATRLLEERPALTEPGVLFELARLSSPETGLFIGSSMPIRDMDSFGYFSAAPLDIAANRGASGIDGTIASAVGFAAGIKKPVLLCLGDLAVLHDLNSLLLASKSDYPLIITAINNRGGGIFSFLPVREKSDLFEEFFATPHDLSFDKAAAMAGLPYYTAETAGQFSEIVKNCLKRCTPAFIEIETDREENYRWHLNILQKLEELINI